MTIQSKTYDKSSGRTCSDVVAGYDVPITALDLSFSFDTMETKSTIENLEGEIWKPILGFEWLYEVSNMGRIKSLHYWGGKRQAIMSLDESRRYTSIVLFKNKKKYTFLVHRLVYSAFYGELPKHKRRGKGDDIYVINHIDENKHNNRLENLELITHTQNINYGTAIHRITQKQRNDPKKSKKVYQYDLDGNLIKIWPSTEECGRNGYNEGHVAASCRNINGNIKGNNKYKGYLWSYVPLKIESK